MEDRIWKWPDSPPQQLAGTAGRLAFVGGAGDFDGRGRIRHPGDLEAQIPGTISNLAAALDGLTIEIDLHRTETEDRRLLGRRRPAAGERLDTREQLAEAEGLGEVVVGA